MSSAVSWVQVSAITLAVVLSQVNRKLQKEHIKSHSNVHSKDPITKVESYEAVVFSQYLPNLQVHFTV